MAEIKEFENNYEEYDNDKQLMDVNDPSMWALDILNPLTYNLSKFLYIFENVLQQPDAIDWFDYTVYSGTSGISLLYYHLSNVLTNSRKEWCINKALYYAEKSLICLRHHHVSYLFGNAGPLAITAIIYYTEGKQEQSRDLINSLEKIGKNVIAQGSGISNELLYGRAGYLYALLLVQKHIGIDSINHILIREVIHSIINSGRKVTKLGDQRPPLTYVWNGKYYLGAAYGLSGILYVLLQAKLYLSLEELSLLETSIDYLLQTRFPSGNFPSSVDNRSDALLQWCHGAPGIIHLLCLAYKYFYNRKYLDAAEQCGDLIWRKGLLKKGDSICHGVAGNAYAFLQLYQLTDEKKHLWRALKFAEWCYDYENRGYSIPKNPFSLFEGLAGTIYFMADMMNPKNAALPGYQL
ncbi:glutathione S-transferase LANCL1-like [Centruroides vittatus]|uniref:glutathione S-transferase LANCL1-like n=1 Tax=Centruroides vittatus TaxID=120091 RepID=UPI00350F562E